ncbi:MAG TPA: hypothetical protein VNA69_08525, partial [Thermoanaerobaculia bacterium]|nr:hypothetical protein [Thermoanaerobaculia bacterium]
MYIEIVPNRGSRPAILLRKGRREGKRTIKQTLANLSDWDDQRIESLRLVLRGVTLFPVDQIFRIERSVAHGHVQISNDRFSTPPTSPRSPGPIIQMNVWSLVSIHCSPSSDSENGTNFSPR